MAHVTRTKPGLAEVTRRLHALGQTSAALDLVRAFGIKEVTPSVPEMPAKYVREKVRYAYVHVVEDVDEEKQKKLLVALVDQLRDRASFSWLPAADEQHLLRIALPGALVVYAYRVPLQQYQKSELPQTIAGLPFLDVYTRKPRADAQHHVNQEN